MTTRVWTDMSDEAFDDAIRAEMNLLAMSNPAPSLRTSAPPRARPGWLPSRPPDRPRHLAPLG
ncbi:MAG TPA: hypothetical protein VN193_10610, partial [Candidatus Angelobacter sp.]|nr:hypothetical protein [Candidatus Angelobacter sp.]